jgi:phosphohistidine phosphatase
MKRLILMRHASAEPASSGGDIDRPLSESGREEAYRMGAWFAECGEKPGLTLCSTARRAKETWVGVQSALDGAGCDRFDGKLYLASSQELFRIATEIEAPHQEVLVIAHNPGISRFALDLTRRCDPDGHERLTAGFRPATAAVLEPLGEDWGELPERGARLVVFSSPRDLG